MDASDVEAKRIQDIRSLVCKDCWEGLFAFKSFQQAWAGKKPDDGFWYYVTPSKLKASVALGCNWCKIIHANWAKYPSDEPRKSSIEVKVGFLGRYPHMDRWLGVYDIIEFVIDASICRTYYVYVDADNPVSQYIAGRTFIKDMSSPLTYKLAADCLEECNRNHEKCPKLQPTPLPTRVIDCKDPQKPKLLIGAGIVGYYAALSYVWGEDQPNKTSEHNIEDYLSSGIELSLIPKTIQDAIVSTHELGLRHLWVDSFCILQDSREDKGREIAQMRKIFRNAYVTFIATSAAKASEGFLHQRKQVKEEFCLPFIYPDGIRIGSMFACSDEDDVENIEPIDKRAWCLEERLLSRRGFEYAPHAIRFFCETHLINVGACPPLWVDCTELRLLPDPVLRNPGDDVDLTRDQLRELQGNWGTVLDFYVSRTVTKPQDKLLALGGVAEYFYTIWGDTYLAGLWKQALPFCLLWRPLGQDSPWIDKGGQREVSFYRPTKYRAPSWSWAAVDGSIQTHLGTYVDVSKRGSDEWRAGRAEVISCHVSLVNENEPFGLVKGGTLVLRGPLITMMWNPGAIGKCGLIFKGDPEREESMAFRAFTDSRTEMSEEGWVEAWVMPIMWIYEQNLTLGLILAPVSIQGAHETGDFYRRIGYFHSSYVDGEKESIKRLANNASRLVNII